MTLAWRRDTRVHTSSANKCSLDRGRARRALPIKQINDYQRLFSRWSMPRDVSAVRRGIPGQA
eukprot:9430752-Pyramimonas_sp.AAC.1